MGVENCCLRPEEKKEEITHSNLTNEEKKISFPHDIEQISKLEANKQLQIQQVNQNANQQKSSIKEENTQEISINEKEKNEKLNNEYNQQGKDFPKENEMNEEKAAEQMEEQVEELGEEEEGQLVEIHEEVEIEDVIPDKEGVKFEEEINPLDHLGETIVQTTYINNPNNINNNNYTQKELNDILNAEGNNISKPANSYINYNSQIISFVSTASAEGAFDLNNMQTQSNEINDINTQNLNYYNTDLGGAVSNNNKDLNVLLLKNGNNTNEDINFNNLG